MLPGNINSKSTKSNTDITKQEEETAVNNRITAKMTIRGSACSSTLGEREQGHFGIMKMPMGIIYWWMLQN